MPTSSKVINMQRLRQEIHDQFGTSEIVSDHLRKMRSDAIDGPLFESFRKAATCSDHGLTYKQKLEVARWIVENNCDTMITGSIAIKERGIDLGREVGDIDILVLTHPKYFGGCTMNLPPLCKEVRPYSPDAVYKSVQYEFFGTKIDFILADDEQREIIYKRNEYDNVFAPLDIICLAKRRIGRSKDDRDIEIIERAIAKGL